MKTVFSPREFASAIGVSESSLKRWIDLGRIPVTRTPGGHRRIPLHAAIRFIRDQKINVAKPEVLGLAEIDRSIEGEQDGVALFKDLLLRGEADAARSFVLTSYASGQSIAEICDGPIRNAMTEIGALWIDHQDGVFIEHRATDICLDVLRALRASLTQEVGRPRAIGGALEGDPYAIPTLMVSTVLTSIGFEATNLGPNTPFDSLLEAQRQTDSGLVWLSLSSIADVEACQEGLRSFAAELASRSVALFLGGRRLGQVDFSGIEAKVLDTDSMVELAAVAKTYLRPQP